MPHLELIYDEDVVLDFLHNLPALDRDEVYFLALFQRNKDLSTDERQHYGLARCNVIARATAADPEKVVRTLRRWECDSRGYMAKNGEPIPNRCLVPYLTVQPVSVIKGYVEFDRIMTEYLVELGHHDAESRARNTFDRIVKAPSLLLDCLQHAYSRKTVIDVDFDIPALNWDGFSLADTFLKAKGVKFYKVRTRGGFHYLLRKTSLTYNYNLTLDLLRDKAVHSFPDQKWEIEVSNNNAVPIPGCLQYGSFQVSFEKHLD